MKTHERAIIWGNPLITTSLSDIHFNSVRKSFLLEKIQRIRDQQKEEHDPKAHDRHLVQVYKKA
jgi:hypothetical protein